MDILWKLINLISYVFKQYKYLLNSHWEFNNIIPGLLFWGVWSHAKTIIHAKLFLFVLLITHLKCDHYDTNILLWKRSYTCSIPNSHLRCVIYGTPSIFKPQGLEKIHIFLRISFRIMLYISNQHSQERHLYDLLKAH